MIVFSRDGRLVTCLIIYTLYGELASVNSTLQVVWNIATVETRQCPRSIMLGSDVHPEHDVAAQHRYEV
jgi:hypothetical protein